MNHTTSNTHGTPMPHTLNPTIPTGGTTMITAQDTTTTITLDINVTRLAGWVGQVVTYLGEQYSVHSIETATHYIFRDGESVKIDTFTDVPAFWLPNPVMTLVPSDGYLGDGRSITVPFGSRYVRRGVCLTKNRW